MTWCNPHYIAIKKFQLQGNKSFDNSYKLYLMGRFETILSDHKKEKKKINLIIKLFVLWYHIKRIKWLRFYFVSVQEI